MTTFLCAPRPLNTQPSFPENGFLPVLSAFAGTDFTRIDQKAAELELAMAFELFGHLRQICVDHMLHLVGLQAGFLRCGRDQTPFAPRAIAWHIGNNAAAANSVHHSRPRRTTMHNAGAKQRTG